jgi:hypothetical protein
VAEAVDGAAVLRPRLERRSDHWRLVGGPVPRGYAAITVGSVVVVRRRWADDEAQHVRQWRRLGVVGFLVRYVGAYVRLRLQGWPHAGAYRRIPLEVEAEWVARQATRP